MINTKILRFEIYVADLDPTVGTELKKARPVLIVSNNLINQYAPQVIGIPFTSNIIRSDGPEVMLVRKSRKNGLNKDSILLGIKIKSLNKLRIQKKLGTLEEKYFPEVMKVLKGMFDID